MTNVVYLRVGKLTEADFEAQSVAIREHRLSMAREAAERATERAARDRVAEPSRLVANILVVGAVAALLAFLYVRYGARVL